MDAIEESGDVPFASQTLGQNHPMAHFESGSLKNGP